VFGLEWQLIRRLKPLLLSRTSFFFRSSNSSNLRQQAMTTTFETPGFLTFTISIVVFFVGAGLNRSSAAVASISAYSSSFST
jgi:hypothetical protein